MTKKIFVRGPALSQSGYGEQTRFCLRALRKFEGEVFDIYLEPTNWGQTGWIWEDTEERRWLDGLIQKQAEYLQKTNGQPQYDMSLQVTIPNEWRRVAPVNIGYTAGIETTKISPVWIQKCAEVDRIIVVSHHAKAGFENSSFQIQDPSTGQIAELKNPKPVVAVNYPVVEVEPDPEFKMDFKHDFNYLCVAQWGPRKNLENTIKWFIEENIDEEVGLILKTSTRNNSITDRGFTQKRLDNLLKEYPQRKCSVYLLHGDLTNNQMVTLYRHPKVKALVALAHGEGFGLPIFEAAYNELPVITVAWSGPNDFMFMEVEKKDGKIKNRPMFAKVDFDLKPVQPEAIWQGVIEKDAMWAFPKEGSYKMRLREVRKNYDRFKSQAKKLAEYIKLNFTEEKKYKEFAEAVVGHELKLVKREDIPKVSLITSLFKAEEHLEGFFEDITSQTIFEDKIELILINANSPENEEPIIKKWMEKYPKNIKYKRYKKDPGLYECWNRALKMATGEFVSNANVDDRRAKNYVERLAKELVANEDVDLVYGDSLVTDQPNETFEVNTSAGRRYDFPEFSFENLKLVNMPHSMPLWRKSIHDRFGFFNSEFKSAGDWEMWLRAASKGSKFKKVPEVLSLYYFNPKGISTNPENEEWKQAEEEKVYNTYKDVEVEK